MSAIGWFAEGPLSGDPETIADISAAIVGRLLRAFKPVIRALIKFDRKLASIRNRSGATKLSPILAEAVLRHFHNEC
jgi:hypothetical protein